MPDWVHFQTQHVLDPAVEPGYSSWNRESWNVWLRGRIPNAFGSKNINSVIIASPEAIIRDFEILQAQHNTGPDFYWSNNRYRIFYMTLDRHRDPSSPYMVKDLGEMFFLAKISRDPNVPVHFHRQYNVQISRGNINITTSGIPEIR